MKNGLERKRWETPVLEKIEMGRTAIICPASGTASKNNSATETGQCGHGPSPS